jgi:hypothetical protein
MYVLDFLKGFHDVQESDLVTFEYRLLCSGELFNGSILTHDWRKSDGARILCDDPIQLLVASHPFHDYPQELALRFRAHRVKETYGIATSSFYPDDDISRDIAAILSVFSWRLITVVTKSRELHRRRGDEGFSEPLLDWPAPFVKSLNPVYWPYKPSTVVLYPDGREEITDYNSPAFAIDFDGLKRKLLRLPSIQLAENFVYSARLYALALTQIHSDVDLAYQLLISAVEAIADEALRDSRPSDDDMVQAKKSVFDLAQEFGLSNDQARQLAINACNGIPWASRKFIKFLCEYCTDDLWNDDDLFHVPTELLPLQGRFKNALRDIYDARSKLTHKGRSFPPSAAIGLGPHMSFRAAASFDWKKKPFPPVAWFERVVNNSLNGFINRTLPDKA